MGLKLVRVVKSRQFVANFNESRYGVIGLNLENLDEHGDYRRRGDFFFVEEKELSRIVQLLAAENSGKNVEVYDLTEVSVCPAAPMVTKKVTKDGVLPA